MTSGMALAIDLLLFRPNGGSRGHTGQIFLLLVRKYEKQRGRIVYDPASLFLVLSANKVEKLGEILCSPTSTISRRAGWREDQYDVDLDNF